MKASRARDFAAHAVAFPPLVWRLDGHPAESPLRHAEGSDMMKRPVTAEEAVGRIAADGARVMIGGFMGVGSPHRLIDELVRQRRRNLTLVCNDTARPGFGLGRLAD